MTFAPAPASVPRARALADLEIGGLLIRADELTRRWAIALVLAWPLDAFGEVPLQALAVEGRSLLEQVVRALTADAELERLTSRAAAGRGADEAAAARLRRIAGGDPVASAVAAEALRGVLWESLSGELHESPARRVGECADRLAFVCASALAAALATATGAGAAAQPRERIDGGAAARREAVRHAQAVIVDEQAPPGAGASGRPLPPSGPTARASTRARVVIDEEPAVRAPFSEAAAEIQIRDERGGEGPAAWIGSIGQQLDWFAHDGVPFAVLLVELLELGQLERTAPAELARVGAQVEAVLARASREFPLDPGLATSVSGLAARVERQPSLTRERPGRYWLLAPTVGPVAAAELAVRLEHAVARAHSGSGARLRVAVGTAVCPEDGRDAASLAAHADVGLYAARSALRAAAGPR